MKCRTVIYPAIDGKNWHKMMLNFLPVALLLAGTIFISSCTSSNLNDGLRPSNNVGSINQQANQPPQIDPNNPTALVPNNFSSNPVGRPTPGIAFLPVIGPPQSAVSNLSSAVRKYAGQNKVTIIPQGQTGAVYQVKGYFSALDDGSGTILVYIWDILDRSGRTLHRISGEERTSARTTDPWAAISSSMINEIVASTMVNLRQWVDSTG